MPPLLPAPPAEGERAARAAPSSRKCPARRSRSAAVCGEGEARGGEPASRPAALTVPAPDAQRPRDPSVRSAARRCAGAAGCAAALSPSRLAHGAPRGAPAAVGPPTPYVSPPRPPRGGGAVRGARGRRRAGAGDGGRRPSGRPGARPRPGQGTAHLMSGGGSWALVGVGRACSGVPEAKLSASALSAQEHPEPRSQRLLPLLPAPAPLRSPARCRGSAANWRAAAARSPPRARRQAGRQVWRWHPRAVPAHTAGLSRPVKGLSAGERCLQALCSQPGPCDHFALTLD